MSSSSAERTLIRGLAGLVIVLIAAAMGYAVAVGIVNFPRIGV